MTKIIAHRGYSAKYPENTLLAFEKALEAGADAIELDVHFTKDNQLVVYHDNYATDGSRVSDQAYDELRQIDVGSVEHGEQYMPLLHDIFERFVAEIHYEIELKGFTSLFLESVSTVVRQYHLEDHIEFTSPYPYPLIKIRDYLPKAKIGMFMSSKPDWMDQTLWQDSNLNNALLGGISVLHCPIGLLNEDFIAQGHKEGLIIHAANCNSEEELKKAFGLKVDQLSTNEAEFAVELKEQA